MKPPTEKMLEILMDCHERELLNQEPPGGTSNTQNTKGLIERGFLKADLHPHPTTGKKYMAFFITPDGKKYLESLK